MKSAIVTGANGFVGSALVKELSSHGIQVYAVVRNRNSNIERIAGLPNTEIVYCELESLDTLADLVTGQPEVFYHMAWSGVSGNDRANVHMQLTNVRWSLDAVKAAKDMGCQKFVGAGTLAELDINAYHPLDGATPNPVSHYGVAKISAHYMTKTECNRLQLEHVWVQLSNTYGVGDNTSNFVNFAAKTMLEGRPADFTPGEQPYDFIYIDDCANGLRCVGESGKNNCTYYIGSTHPAKLKEFIIKIRDEIDPEIQLNFGALPFNGNPHPWEIFDCSKLVKDTGYEPRVSFEEGIRRTVDWLRK